MKYNYINNFTGAIYTTLFEAIKASFSDIIHYPKCRDIRIFSISRLEEE